MTTNLKNVVRNFGRRIGKYFSRNLLENNLKASKNLVGPRHPRASARHCVVQILRTKCTS